MEVSKKSECGNENQESEVVIENGNIFERITT